MYTTRRSFQVTSLDLYAGDIIHWEIECQYDIQIEIWQFDVILVFLSYAKTGFFFIEQNMRYCDIFIHINTGYAGYINFKYSVKKIPFALLLGLNLAMSIVSIIIFIRAMLLNRKRKRELKDSLKG